MEMISYLWRKTFVLVWFLRAVIEQDSTGYDPLLCEPETERAAPLPFCSEVGEQWEGALNLEWQVATRIKPPHMCL